jgi:hypothetical protein
MRAAERFFCALVGIGSFLGGCKQSEPGEERREGEAPKRPPKLATMYVESQGEPLNAGGKAVEKSDAAGSPKGGFSPKDLLMPGMFVLVSGATALGGPLLIKALDKKDRPAGAVAVAGGGSEGTFVPVEASGTAGGSTDVPGSTGSPESPGTGMPDPSSPGTPPGEPTTPVEPASITAVAKSGPSTTAPTLAAGRGVASTRTTILLAMGYASDFSGPSYISGKMTSSGLSPFGMTETWVYSWELTVDKTSTTRSGKVDVFASFTGLKAGDLVTVQLFVTTGATFTCDHKPLVFIPPVGGLKDQWLYYRIPDLSTPPRFVCSLTFRLSAPGVPIRLGYLTVEGETDIVGESTAEVTVH